MRRVSEHMHHRAVQDMLRRMGGLIFSLGGAFFVSFRKSELEIDEGLEAGGDELVEEEDRQDTDEGHDGQGKHCEAQAVAAFETGREPVDKHSEGHEQKDLPIGGADVRDD